MRFLGLAVGAFAAATFLVGLEAPETMVFLLAVATLGESAAPAASCVVPTAPLATLAVVTARFASFGVVTDPSAKSAVWIVPEGTSHR